ncbi:hypothetical protein [Candidatus Igneacidithiobacillus taiwanensis]|uniref:hypothetical protein n=1 Tax=Candidatus Igneacidithiobacillus taiwanensis TaxID=1945924 RepID=UPI00289A5C0C|nr:hypothetical protein [Candidatus Igneacidithiobacillus taiwanensis]MCE5361339.1 hypothetical protein [Acidithiobacillus sp.]
MWYVTISQDIMPDKRGDGWEELKIASGSVQFFQDPILSGFRGYMLESKGSRLWKIRFFEGSDFKESLFVRFSRTEPEKDNEHLFQAFSDEFSGDTPSPDQVERASQWLRESNSILLKDYTTKNANYLFLDGHGLATFSKGSKSNSSEDCPARFQRYIILLCLCAAYKLRIEKLINELAEAQDDCTKLNEIIKNAYRFSARHYFRHPVRMKNIELPFVWDEIRDRMRLQEYFDEFLSQASALHHLVADEERERQRAHQEKLSNRMTLALVLLALLTLVESLPLVGVHQ